MKKQKGFSLIELLIVVGIIGALTAIAVPVYSDYKKKSDVAAAVASVKSLVPKAEVFLGEVSTNTLATFITATTAKGGLGAAATGLDVGKIGKITGAAAAGTGDDATDGKLVFTFDTSQSFPGSVITFTRGGAVWACTLDATLSAAVDNIKGCADTATP
ncbi:hypothetical protein A1OK_04515 [Enterovibrio norvegicus FF-454]|uniref:Prepilin-type N-terminal cleavage/methylation domain-containing protein n=1 Tax=Enterovibrio norvegicus FF-454 TaxID=1185651 RepID=A0A1E5BXI1_9GAMM|nr:prepilin-type N-terminal cleavage/methylation domain-containing protein [Enterovibrio norvegicus]OEE57900.1 hypothetical protein A1OK_04515 [Enterovibrio norvegicus FF-454]